MKRREFLIAFIQLMVASLTGCVWTKESDLKDTDGGQKTTGNTPETVSNTQTFEPETQVISTQQPASIGTSTLVTNVSVVTSSKAFPGTAILGRPSAESIALSLLNGIDTELYVQYGRTSGNYDAQTGVCALQHGEPLNIEITGLDKDTQYYYRICHRISGEREFSLGSESIFHTQRAPGSSFVFTVQADSHRDVNSSDAIYKTTLLNALRDKPDFHIDLGDTFMGEKWAKSYQTLANRYMEERNFFSLLCASSPLFLANGNHDGEKGIAADTNPDILAIWATNCRKRYYPTPSPGNFYSSSSNQELAIGLRQSYYAWHWGNALFVVLDPYWYGQGTRNAVGWGVTLGKEQYDWLKSTLENSVAKFKFVFCHNVVGGFDMGSVGNMRGGDEAAVYYEWGGLNTNGTRGFEANRPAWSKPIHRLLVDNNVTVFFHGHDHFFAKQELDGVIYQECPQPSSINNKSHASEYGYKNGVFLDGTGYVRILVSDMQVKISYIRTYLPEKETANQKNAELAYSYTLDTKG
jgi:hypothetical protein